jgi:Dihydroorotate dehydrogenase
MKPCHPRSFSSYCAKKCNASVLQWPKEPWLFTMQGASLVELYTSLVYEGPALIPRLKRELDACLLRDGFASVADAVGADHRPPGRRK